MPTDDRTFFTKWVAANGVAEAAGLGTTFVLGMSSAPLLDADNGLAGILGVAFLAVLLGTFLEGVVVGMAQGAVLQQRRADIRRRSWILGTTAGAGLAWVVGMIPSTAMALSAPAADQSSIQEPALFVQLLLAAGLGMVTGPILGGAQWWVLKTRVPGAASWLWANQCVCVRGM